MVKHCSACTVLLPERRTFSCPPHCTPCPPHFTRSYRRQVTSRIVWVAFPFQVARINNTEILAALKATCKKSYYTYNVSYSTRRSVGLLKSWRLSVGFSNQMYKEVYVVAANIQLPWEKFVTVAGFVGFVEDFASMEWLEL